MSDPTEKLRQELLEAQEALAEASARCARHDAEHLASGNELEDNRRALLFMLEDLETERRRVEQAHREWMIALDALDDPILLHDWEFRILRCNKAYQNLAGIPFKQLIGQPYFDIFPKTGAPLPSCLRAMGKEAEEEEEVMVGNVIYRVRAYSILDAQGAYLHSMHILEDITERRHLDSLLREDEQSYRTLADSAPALIWTSGTDKLCNYINRPWLEFTGRTLEQAFGNGWTEGVHPDDFRHCLEVYVSAFERREPFSMEYRLRRHDGEFRWMRDDGRPRYDSDGNFAGYIGYLMDITERKRTERVLHESEEKFRKITWAAQDAIIMMGADRRISFWNTAAERVFGYTAEEAMGQELHPLITPVAAQAAFKQGFQHFLESGEGPVVGKVVEVGAIRKGGEEFPVELSISSTRLNGQWHAIAIVRDITERKRAEQALIESRRRAQYYLDVAGVMLVSIDAQGRVQMVNRKGCEMLGYPEAEILGKDWFGNYLPEAVREEVRKAFERIRNGDTAPFEYFENDILTAGGKTLTVAWHNTLLLDESGKISGVLSSGEDITARKKAEAATQHANRALAALSAVNRSLVRASSEDELLQLICNAIVHQRGYHMTWVGYVQHDENKSIKIKAYTSDSGNYPDTMQPTWADEERGMGPSGRAVRSGATQLCQDIANDSHYSPWRDEALKCGYAASIALPLLKEDKTVFGTLTVYANEVNAFDPSEISLLEEMAGDLAFGVLTLHTRHERDFALVKNQEQLVQLQESLEDTVRAIATIVEMRDPYTAGHQIRVADLAMTIAKQLGLPEDQVHTIHLAGIVHDLGKINIPAEILSKPGKISVIEYSLIKVHAQAGYDILKGINFPWPIAQMVLQHHERLDGSGYPQGLKGDAILLEARILCVADVVEAISAHRPYRPGLGIEAALEEITRQRGVYYDSRVVDACLVVFREQGYSFA